MPCSTTWAHSCSAMVLPMWTMSSAKGVPKHSHSCSCQGCKATNHTGTLLNSPQPSGTFGKLPPEPTPAHTGTLRTLPEVASGTYTSTHWNPPEPSGSCHLPEVAYTSTHRNLPEPSGSCLRNLHQHTLEPSGPFRKLPPEPTPARTGTLQNLPEPASGTYTSTHRNSPEPSGTFLRNLLLRPAPAHTGAYLG